MADRRCQQCNGAVPARMSRQRDGKGNLVCDSCITKNTPEWDSGMAYAASMGMASEMRRRCVEAVASVAKVMRARAAATPRCVKCSERLVLASGLGNGPSVWVHAAEEDADHDAVAPEGISSTGSISIVAHDSGDNAVINHCPFCGSGGVIGKGEGTVSCEFCHSNFTVQVQPAHPFMPQTVDGQPVPPAGMPGEQPTEMSAPLDPAVNETEEGVVDPEQAAGPTPFNGAPPAGPAGPPAGDKPKGKVPPQFAKGSSSTYATAEGHVLDTEAYMARLALAFADDKADVLDLVRHANLQRQAEAPALTTRTCPVCKGEGDVEWGTECEECGGTGMVALGAKQADLLNPDSRIDDNDRDLLALTDEDWAEDLLLRAHAPTPNGYVDTPGIPPWLRDERGGFYPSVHP